MPIDETTSTNDKTLSASERKENLSAAQGTRRYCEAVSDDTGQKVSAPKSVQIPQSNGGDRRHQ